MTRRLHELLDHTLAGEVDLDGVVTAADYRAAILRDAPELLEQRLIGDSGTSPTIDERLAEVSDA